jgi:CheY-like chemotaxis protein
MGEPPRVLLVEDDDDFRELLAELLAGEGFRVSPAASAEEALSALRAGGLDAVVTDLSVPVAGGLAVARAAKARGPIPVVVVTGHAAHPEVERARGREVDAVLLKPVDPGRLAQAIRRVIAARGPA